MMDDMTLTPVTSRREVRIDDRSLLQLSVEEGAHGRRVAINDDVNLWIVTLPVGGFDFDVMQYQIVSGDANLSAVLELKLEGDTYRRAVAGVREDASPAELFEALRVLIGPVMSLLGMVEPSSSGPWGLDFSPSWCSQRTNLVVAS